MRALESATKLTKVQGRAPRLGRKVGLGTFPVRHGAHQRQQLPRAALPLDTWASPPPAAPSIVQPVSLPSMLTGPNLSAGARGRNLRKYIGPSICFLFPCNGGNSSPVSVAFVDAYGRQARLSRVIQQDLVGAGAAIGRCDDTTWTCLPTYINGLDRWIDVLIDVLHLRFGKAELTMGSTNSIVTANSMG